MSDNETYQDNEMEENPIVADGVEVVEEGVISGEEAEEGSIGSGEEEVAEEGPIGASESGVGGRVVSMHEFDGDVAVGRNLMLGGRASIQGSAFIGHNMIVRGWLDARNIRGTNKGVFVTLSDLQSTYPDPLDGWLAGVGVSSPFAAYVGRSGAWEATGGTIELNVDMSVYTEKVEELTAQMAELMRLVPIVTLRQEEYDAIEEKVESRFYFIINEDNVVYRIYTGSQLFAESAGGLTFPFTFPFPFAS